MTEPHSPRRGPHRFMPQAVIARAVWLVCVGLACGAGQAQTTNPADPATAPATPAVQRVEVTGSLIKRIDTEQALPVQVITREEIDKLGITTASELMSKITAASNGLTDGASINIGGYDQKGLNSANLRGIGTSSTLVLLNGRRMANFASPGDDAGVDLNNIPAAAIDHVDILLDGASATYGTDAIGGVINFITRRDYRGADINAYLGGSQEGGAGKRAVSVSAGVGDYGSDGFNLFGVFDVQQTDRLSTSQREFISDLRIPERLPHLLSGYTNPANIRLSGEQRDYLQEQGFTINGKPIVNRTINLSQPGCNPPANLYLPNGTGGEDACTYDYMRDTELYPKSEKLNFLARGALQLGGDHQLFGEIALSRAKTWYTGSSARVTGALDYSRIPELADYKGLEDIDREIELRIRLEEAGRRTSELTSQGQRYLLGLSGTLGGWEYDTALNHSVNTVADRDTHGYLLYNELIEGIADGRINPFGPSSAEGQALIDSIQVNDVVRQARGTMDAIDFKASRPLLKLDGGEMAVAVGAEFRRERTTFTPSALLLSDNINNDFAPEGGQATSDARKVAAIYAELDAPVTPELSFQLAARTDRYQGVGTTTNPKLGIKYTPSREVLLRASAGTGFRAPSLTDLYRPTQYSATSVLPDPVYCAENDNDLSVCADNWNTRRYSNTQLKPERSKQFSIGAVVAANDQFTFSVDYWKIEKRDLISEIGDDVILANLAKYEPLVHRYNEDEGLDGCDYDPGDSTICYIELRKENRGRQKVSGVDITADLRNLRTGVGTFGLHLNATLALVSKQQFSPGDAYLSNLGRFVTDGVVQRWRHRLSADWELGAWALTLGNTFYMGYDDQNSAINTDDGSIVSNNHVKPYSLWDLSGSYEFSPEFKVRAGIQNLFNTAPPFSNQAYYFLSGYDPTYTDPRGRFFYLSANYAFR